MIRDKIIRTAREIQGEAQRLGLVGTPPAQDQVSSVIDLMALYDALVSSQGLRSATRQLFSDGHYAEAVEEAYKCVNNAVKRKVGTDRDGSDLMHYAFNEDNPNLKLNGQRSQSERDEQAGYRFIFAGCMTGIRNPRAHGHDLRDDPVPALEMLAWANHLLRVIDRAKRAMKRRSRPRAPSR